MCTDVLPYLCLFAMSVPGARGCQRRVLEGWEEKVAVGGWLETVNPLSDKTTLHNKGLNGPLHQQEYYSE